MSNNTFEDYKKAIRIKYEIEKEGVYFNFLTPPSQANLRNLCWERFKSNENKDDLSVFSSFFKFEFDLEKKNGFNEQTDRFRPIGSFLKGEKTPANRYAVELAAVLVDYQPRPFKKFKEKGLILEDRPIGIPKIPLPFKEYNEKEEEVIDECDKDEDESDFETPPLSNNQGNLFDNFRNRFSKKFTKKFKQVFIVMLLLFALIFAVIYFAVIKKHCMQWSEDHYEIVDCNSGIEGNLNSIIPLDENLLDFRKIKVCDTTTCFKENGKAIVWYTKTGNGADFFNTHGRHPINEKPLRPITKYIKEKYGSDCLTQK
jgi:hypothetical protein